MDRAVKQSDKMEAALMQRLEGIYSDALMDALKKHQGFLQLVKDVADGKKKPPARYADNPEKIAQWKAGFLREQMRQMGVIESISKDLAAVGPEAAEQIKDTMADVYAVNREFTTDMIQNAVHTSFSQYDKRQIRVLMQETESPFSKIAYKNLGKDTLIRKRLQNEMATATLLGESQRDIIKRIRKVTGQTAYQAKRVAQTERTRIQSQARYEACQEAADKGVHVVNTWTAKMDNTRDAHAERNGQKAEQGKPFPGSVMKYPGDPAGGAAEVINCHCVLVPDVVMPAEKWSPIKTSAMKRDPAAFRSKQEVPKKRSIVEVQDDWVKNGFAEKVFLPESMEEDAIAEFEAALTPLSRIHKLRSIVYNPSACGQRNAIAFYDHKTNSIYFGKRCLSASEFSAHMQNAEKAFKRKATESEFGRYATGAIESGKQMLANAENAGRKKMAWERIRSGWQMHSWSTRATCEQTLSDVIKHEYAHALHLNSGMVAPGGSKTNWMDWLCLNNPNQKNVPIYADACSLSAYAAQSPLEAVSEAYVAMQRGEDVPDVYVAFWNEVIGFYEK